MQNTGGMGDLIIYLLQPESHVENWMNAISM